VLTAFGVPLGLRPDLLIAGFSGSLVAIILLNTVPGIDTTFSGLLRSTLRRVTVAFASSLTAGYLTPLVMLMSNIPEPLLLGSAFVVGGGAQQILAWAINKFAGKSLTIGDSAS
jgi:hypothetical protein